MNILVSGARGLVGGALLPALQGKQYCVRSLLRSNSQAPGSWNPTTGELPVSTLDEWPPDAFVHLAGENIAGRRWSPAQKERIRSSRVQATELLVASLLQLPRPPGVFVSASAVGYYGHRGDEILTEQAGPGLDFLSQVARDWEQAALPLASAGVRVVHLRFGMILSRAGGALAKMLLPFKLGLGGRLGSGRQWMSWIALSDVVRVIEWALENPGARGAYNVVSPIPVTNADFTRALARVLKKPALLPAPARMLRLIFGEMADALLLSSQRAIPQRLLAEGFNFEVTELGEALRN